MNDFIILIKEIIMGINMYGYVGPFGRLPQVKLQVEVEKYRCSDPLCKNHYNMDQSNKFCPLCGAKGVLEKSYKEEVDIPDYHDFMEEVGLDSEMLSLEGNYLIPNKGYTGFGDSFSDHDDNQEFKITMQNVEKSQDDFKNTYKVVLDTFKEKYGVEITVSFGVLTYTG